MMPSSNSTTLTIVSTMTPERFADWLRGFLDACGDKPTQKQVEEIRKKLGTVAAPYQPPAPIHAYPLVTQPTTLPTPSLIPWQPYSPWEPYKITCETPDLTAFTGTTGINWNPGNVQ